MVATPIGNLKDMTLRAIETLKTVELIACEDTRHSAILLKAYDIHTPTTSFHSYSTAGKRARLLERLRCGTQMAVISDAGLPGISDPGTALIHDAIATGVPVTVIPGASASLVGLILSGFPTDRFVFEGFLPVKSGARRRRLQELQTNARTAVIYESPHRLVKTFVDIEAVYGDVPISCSRELTKLFEETRREPVSRLREHFTAHRPRGEFVLVLPPQRRPSRSSEVSGSEGARPQRRPSRSSEVAGHQRARHSVPASMAGTPPDAVGDRPVRRKAHGE